jgi:hypothetical protein
MRDSARHERDDEPLDEPREAGAGGKAEGCGAGGHWRVRIMTKPRAAQGALGRRDPKRQREHEERE